MYDALMETLEFIWVNIWCTLDLIVAFCHKTAKNTFAWHAEHGEMRIYVL